MVVLPRPPPPVLLLICYGFKVWDLVCHQGNSDVARERATDLLGVFWTLITLWLSFWTLTSMSLFPFTLFSHCENTYFLKSWMQSLPPGTNYLLPGVLHADPRICPSGWVCQQLCLFSRIQRSPHLMKYINLHVWIRQRVTTKYIKAYSRRQSGNTESNKRKKLLSTWKGIPVRLIADFSSEIRVYRGQW